MVAGVEQLRIIKANGVEHPEAIRRSRMGRRELRKPKRLYSEFGLSRECSEGLVSTYCAVLFSHNQSVVQLLSQYFSLITSLPAYTVKTCQTLS